MINKKADIATKVGFGQGVLEAARLNPHVLAIGADITSSVSLDLFREAYPDRFISLGIAEQNCMAVAAGLALAGKIPVFSTYGVFSALRTTDQVRISVCYNNVHVIIGGAHAGISVGPDGATHQALEDIAIMRVLPNMSVFSPCDATQAKLITRAAILELRGPAYIRYGREAVPDFTDENQKIELGKGQELKSGTDLTIIATGHMTWEALQAAWLLEKKKLSARVINIHTIKPLDKEIILKAASETGAIITAEEHQLYGGFGSAVAEVLVQNHPVPVEMIGMPDCFGESGQPSELMEKYGLTASNIVNAALKILQRK
ncbi:MAG TPA: transketolase C-terminal domain-containing protein [Bacteroidales bacterium]|nr:transketolase C-terminal domain-containing protein [Bacteroidales bacterium]